MKDNKIPSCFRGEAQIEVSVTVKLDARESHAYAEAELVTVANDAEPEVETLLAQIVADINAATKRKALRARDLDEELEECVMAKAEGRP